MLVKNIEPKEKDVKIELKGYIKERCQKNSKMFLIKRVFHVD